MKECNNYLDLIGRVLIGAVFLFAGYGKIVGFKGTQGYMSSSAMGALGATFISLALIIAIIIEVGGGLMLIIGYRTRLVGTILAGFILLATLFFHMGPGQTMNLTKNLMILGGLLVISAHGAKRLSLDARCGNCECKEGQSCSSCSCCCSNKCKSDSEEEITPVTKHVTKKKSNSRK